MKTMRIPLVGVGLAAALFVCACSGAGRGPDGEGSAAAAGPMEGTVPSADGVEIHYRADGAGEPALVFAHGWSCDGSYWDEQVKRFSPRHRVVAIDLAGHGASGQGRSEWSIEAYARDLQAVVEKLGLRRAVLVGHSMSGYVILEAARLMPERVVGLIPIDTLHDAEERLDPTRVEEALAGMRGDFPAATEAFVRSMFPKEADAALVDRVAKDMAAEPPAVAIGTFERIVAYDPKPALQALRQPIHAINSEYYPTRLESNRRYAPQFEATLIGGVGHFPMLEKPEEFNGLLEQVLGRPEFGGKGADAEAGAAAGSDGA
jgi:pimeloyl-ACP methyl ester carboxylesterase